ncbi:hypothetical protein D9757_008902 [Collybiopsis confluens]|uniref:Sister chromatid cohesion protein n=1 Tax=Collybiopsis confluens TaxID=2823264 RepID=A0A8H5H4Z0_9AGAR|nr:hypothetical protein D9757_008902 [Collybiopsis confluens]
MANGEHNRSVRDSHRLLASYPVSSAVPSAHVARHLDSLSVPANPPSFLNHHHYAPPPYSPNASYPEYSNEIQSLGSNQPQASTGGYWERTRDHALALLNEQAGGSYPYVPPQQWTTPYTNFANSSMSSYQTPHMAQAIISNGYPTPPPPPPLPHPSTSFTSSLAGALGPTPTQHQYSLPPRQHLPPPPLHRHAPEDSAAFFNNVLAQKVQQINHHHTHPAIDSRTSQNNSIQRSDPLTPGKKRKLETSAEPPSPSKRANLGRGFSASDAHHLPSTPSKLGLSIFPKTPSTIHSITSSVPQTPTTVGLATPRSERSASATSGTSLKRKTLTLDSIESIPALQKPYITPTTGGRIKRVKNLHSGDGTDTEIEDYEHEFDLMSSPLKPLLYDSSRTKHKAGRDAPLTHERDERTPLNKLVLLIDDIFQTEDGLPSDPTSADLSSSGIFHPDSVDLSKPQLSAPTIRKLTKLIGQVKGGRGMGKSVHTSPVKGRTGKSGRITDIEVDILSRLLRVLSRNVKLGEEVDPFGVSAGAAVVKDKDVAAMQKTPKKKKSRTPLENDNKEVGDVEQEEMVEEESTVRGQSKEPRTPKKDKGKGKAAAVTALTGPPSVVDLELLAHKLKLSRDGVLAAETIIALLAGEGGKGSRGGERLSKQLYSEEIILGCMNVVKTALEGEIYPFVEGCSGTGNGSLTYLVHNASLSTSKAQFSPSKGSNASSSSIAQSQPAKAEACRSIIGEIFSALSAVLPRISALVSGTSFGGDGGVSMSDTVVIKAVYVGIGPFFVSSDEGSSYAAKEDRDWDDHDASPVKSKSKGKRSQGSSVLTSTFGKSAMRGLRMNALGLIRSIFTHHDDQRSWIIEEILSSLIKVSHAKQGKSSDQFRLRDGKSMRTVSALLLQLVQTSAHDVRLGARKIDRTRQIKVALRRQESIVEQSQASIDNDEFLDEEDRAAMKLHSSGLVSPHKAASTIIHFLTSRSGKTKATKNSNEAEYRAIFDALVQDCLSVWCWPEWPSAGVVLGVIVKGMVRSLEEDNVKERKGAGDKETAGDSSASKSIALDHIGVIAARVRSLMVKVHAKEQNEMDGSLRQTSSENVATKGRSKALKPLTQILERLDIKELDRYLNAHWDSAQELSAAILGQDLAAALQKVSEWVEDRDSQPVQQNSAVDADLSENDSDERTKGKQRSRKKNDEDGRRNPTRLRAFSEQLKNALREVWKERSTDLFDIGSPEEVIRVDRQAEEIGTVQGNSLKNAFMPMLTVTLHALDAPIIFMRTKALKALGQVITSDPNILAMPNVRKGIENHLLDSSPAVRDAAVELIGKYMIDSPDVAADYYPKISERIADTGLSVRKRVIKLLKAFYNVSDSVQRQTDISTKLVLRMMDEDDTVKDLAIKSLEELWFPSSMQALPSALKGSKSTSTSNESLQNKVAVIMAVSASFRDRQSPLEDLLHKIMSAKEEGSAEAQTMHKKYQEMCSILIDGLVDDTDLPGFTVINCIRTIHLFASAYPLAIDNQSAMTLLPYLKNPTNTEEQMTSDYLLRTFRVTIPHMPKTAAKFGQDLQVKLQPMVTKPSTAGGISTMQEVVACLTRLQQAITKPGTAALTPNELRPLVTLIFIVSLLAEHCNFDQLRIEQSSFTTDLNSVTPASITEYVYNSLLQLRQRYDDPSFRSRVLPCLGFLFRAQPTLMTLERSATIMDEIFAANDYDGKARLLKIIQDFLVSESIKHSQSEKESESTKHRSMKAAEVNMEELVGNTDGFADSGVSSAIVQRYMDSILEAAFSPNTQIQALAIDILTFTVKQGLAHPLQSFPVIVALETSPSTSLSNRASALHAVLHNKHASLLNSRFTLSARKSFEYQRKISPNGVRGYQLAPTPMAVLQRWYSLVREKRAQRQDFLKALVKVFQDRPDYKSTQDDVEFTRYMAENFASFDYKTQEEVFTVVKFLTAVLSTTGLHVLEVLSPSPLLAELHAGPTVSADTASAHNPVEGGTSLADELPFIRTSVIVGIVMLLKAYLKTLYALSEEKCSKFSLSKKSAVGDKAAVKRHSQPINWERLPFAVKPVLTSVDVKEQRERFRTIWFEDGVAAEPEDEFASQ